MVSPIPPGLLAALAGGQNMIIPPGGPGMPPPGMIGPPMGAGGPPPPMGPPMAPPPPMGPPPGMPMGGPPPGMMGAMPGAMPGGLQSGPPPGVAGPMPGAPPPNPMDMMGPNPILMLLQDPTFLEKLLPPMPLPRYREKWQEPPKPTEGEMLDRARQDQTMLTTINRRFQDDLARIRMEAAGVFDDFDPDAEIPFKSSALADEDQLIAALVGTIPPAYETKKLKPLDEDENQIKEDFLWYLHGQHRRQHARSGWGDLDIEMTKTITRYGRIITCSLCDFNAPKGGSPFKMRVIDPSICYPTFMGPRGLVRVTLIYQSSISDLIGNHDQDGEIEKQVLQGSMTNDKGSAYQLNDIVEVIEYWDCKYMGVFVAGKLVKGPVAHDYGEPPFVYTIAPYGDPGYTRTPLTYDENTGYDSGSISGQEDFARRGLSHFHTRFDTHAQREAIFGRLMTALAMWKDDPLYIQRDQVATGLDTPQISRARGARNIIPEGFHLLPPPDAPVPPTLGPLLQASNDDVSRSGLSPAEYGLTPSAQQSGYAIAGLSENGKNKLAPVILTKSQHHALVAEQRLRFFRDWGHLLGDHGAKGSVIFPKALPESAPDDTPYWELTPAMIDRTGIEVDCTLIDTPDVGTLAAMAQALGALGQQGVITRRDKIKLVALPGSRNPQQTMRDVDIEQLKEMPEYKLGQLLKYVYEQEDDPGLANFIAAQIAKGKAKEAAQAMGPPGGGGMPGANGLSGPLMGHPPGQEGGRPPGPPTGAPPPPPGPGTEP